MNRFEERVKRTEWMMKDRFGMFIHWGLYAIPARGEWIRNQERITVEDYQQYFDEFNPTEYDPKTWAKLAKEAGMKYAVMTAKHHDGFCLFDSALTEYKATNTHAGRDLIREYVDAFRAEGLKVGLYYSLLDWHHPDYPKYGDLHHPMRDNEAFKDEVIDFEKYKAYLHGQVKELLSNYGQIDVMWFDFSYKNDNYDMSGDKWGSKELVEMMRSIQPDIVIDNRLEVNHGMDNDRFTSGEIEDYTGDFVSPEQIIPAGGIADSKSTVIPWEACITLNNHWGYSSTDIDYKTPKQVIHALVECVSKGGNLLLNVGPDATGVIPDESVAILQEVGQWMKRNGDSIYGAGCSDLSKPEWGRYTQKGNMLYAHIYERGIGPTSFEGLSSKIINARLLRDGSEVQVLKPWNAVDFPDDAFIDLGSQQLPDDKDTVVAFKLK